MLLLWNVRGLNDPRKQKKLKLALQKHHLTIICLLETHVKQSNCPSIVEYLLPGWSFIANYDSVVLGRIWICFDSRIRMDTFSISA